MIFKGLKFGMLLQFAIGPVCIYIIKTAISSGILAGLAATIAATFMDSIFVLLAILGIGSIIQKTSVKIFMKYFGSIVLFYFGIGCVLSSLNIAHIIPGFSSSVSSTNMKNSFLTSFILTASSPLSILFWTGVFSVKISVEKFCKSDLIYFGIGSVLATLLFLSSISILFGVINKMIPNSVVNLLNVIVGIIIILFGFKIFRGSKQTSNA